MLFLYLKIYVIRENRFCEIHNGDNAVMVSLSVVIPTYNSELLIERCLHSLITQAYQDFEICIIDAASSDGTIAKVNQFRSKFENIRILSEQDLGIYDAMNKGISFSKGEWIYFLGSDDEMYSSDIFSSIFLNTFNLQNDVLYGNVSGKRLGDCYDGEFTIDKLYLKNICHQAIFLKRHVFEKIGLYDLKYKVLADYDHNIRWFCDPEIKNKFIDTIIANYSDSETAFSSLNEDSLFVADKPLIFLRQGFFLLKYETKMNILDFIVEDRSKQSNLILYIIAKIIRRMFFCVKSFFIYR
jgi:glycosyltransferase involved in cell wall biosynthesis